MSLQIAILKVLVSHPEGRATIGALNSDLSILYTSGSDWIDRLRRLAARAPGLDIFGQRLVLRDSSGWQITPAGRCKATATACETWTICRPKTAACLRARVKSVTVPWRRTAPPLGLPAWRPLAFCQVFDPEADMNAFARVPT